MGGDDAIKPVGAATEGESDGFTAVEGADVAHDSGGSRTVDNGIAGFAWRGRRGDEGGLVGGGGPVAGLVKGRGDTGVDAARDDEVRR